MLADLGQNLVQDRISILTDSAGTRHFQSGGTEGGRSITLRFPGAASMQPGPATLEIPGLWLTDGDVRSGTAEFGIAAIAMLLLLAAAACAFAVIAPRRSSPAGEGIVFFGAVAQRASGNDYVADVASRSPTELTALRLKHCFDPLNIMNPGKVLAED